MAATLHHGFLSGSVLVSRFDVLVLVVVLLLNTYEDTLRAPNPVASWAQAIKKPRGSA